MSTLRLSRSLLHPPASRSVLSLAAAAVFAASLCIPGKAAAAAEDAVVLPGEIQVEGTIKSVDRIHGTVVVEVSTVSLPTGRVTVLPAPRAKLIELRDDAFIHVRGSAQHVSVSQIHAGAHTLVTGKDLGIGKALPTRDMGIWDSRAGGVYHMDGIAAPVTLNPGADTAVPTPAAPVAPVTIPLDRPVRAFSPGQGIVWSVAFSSDGKMLAAGGDVPRVLKTQTGGQTLDTAVNTPGAAAPSGAHLWNVQTGDLLRSVSEGRPVYAVAFSPDGAVLATANSDGFVRLWDTRNGDALQTMGTAGRPVFTVAFSPRGDVVASSTGDNAVALWDARTGAAQHTLTGASRNVGTVAFAPDGSVAASGSSDGTLTLWDPQTMEVKQTIPMGATPASKIAFSPDGASVAAGAKDGGLTLWDLKTGHAVWTTKTHAGKVQSIAISPDGRHVATGGDRKVEIWDMRDGTIVTTINAHRAAVTSIAFSPDGQTLATSSMDGQVKLWKVG